jgi:hypothetical protein
MLHMREYRKIQLLLLAELRSMVDEYLVGCANLMGG